MPWEQIGRSWEEIDGERGFCFEVFPGHVRGFPPLSATEPPAGSPCLFEVADILIFSPCTQYRDSIPPSKHASPPVCLHVSMCGARFRFYAPPRLSPARYVKIMRAAAFSPCPNPLVYGNPSYRLMFSPMAIIHARIGITMSAEMGQDRRDVVKSTFGELLHDTSSHTPSPSASVFHTLIPRGPPCVRSFGAWCM